MTVSITRNHFPTACREELEHFSEIICYEKTNEVGGLWHYRDNYQVTTVQFTTVANSSKEMSAFSDFPPPPNWPNYLHHTLMLKYLLSYAKHFHLLDHIKTGHEVIEVWRSHDNKWNVRVKDTNNFIKDEQFDCVMICSGHHTHAYAPPLPGQQQFKGECSSHKCLVLA